MRRQKVENSLISAPVKDVARKFIIVLSIVTLLGTAETTFAGQFQDFWQSVRRAFTGEGRYAPPPPRRKHHRARKHHGATTTHDAGGHRGDRSEASPNEQNTQKTKRAVAAKGDKRHLQYGTPVPGKKGLITSPFSPDKGYIDVRGFAPGTPVKDPYSGKIILTP
jgi:hypothetical protein